MGNFLTDLFSTKPAQDAANAKIAGYTSANTNANAAIDQGVSQATPLYGQALGGYQPLDTLAGKFGAGQDAYNDATGVNGAAGIDRATTNFKSLPGYQGGLDTGINQVERTAAQRGDVGGGNTSADMIKFASDYDANKYGNYVSSLAPNLTGALSATTSSASGKAGVLGSEATNDMAAAGAKATNDFNSGVGSGNAQADADLAPYQASSNFWSSLLGVGQLGLKASGIGGFAPTPPKMA